MSAGADAAGKAPALTVEDLAYVLHPLVPLRLMAAAARAQGRLQYLLRKEERTRVRDNLGPVTERRPRSPGLAALTRRAFEYRQLRTLMYTLHPKLASSRAAELFPIDGLDHFVRAQAEHTGVVLACSHLNSVCNVIVVERLRAVGFDVRLMLPSEEQPYPLSALGRRAARSTFRERTAAFYSQFNLRPIMRALGEDASVAIVADGWHSAGFVEADFLGRRVSFSTGAASVARLADTALVPVFVTGAPPHGMRIVFDDPIVPDAGAGAGPDVERMVRAYARALERRVAADLPCWQHWFEERTLDTMARPLDRSLAERYRMGAPSAGQAAG